MKSVTFLIVRHGRHVPRLFDNLEQEELERARLLGGSDALSGFEFDAVVTSPLPRAIQTAMAIAKGNESFPFPREVVPAFGNDAMFKAMKEPEGFEKYASRVGFYEALPVYHSSEVTNVWRQNAVDAFDLLVSEALNGQQVLLVAHSPIIELLLSGLMQRQGFALPNKFKKFNELDSAIVLAQQGTYGAITAQLVKKLSVQECGHVVTVD